MREMQASRKELPCSRRSPSGCYEIATGPCLRRTGALDQRAAAYYRINPATAAKGIGMLTDDGLVEKRRGVGMFVAAGARARLLGERRKRFTERYVEPLVAEAGLAGIDADEPVAMIRQSSYAQKGTRP